MLVISRHEHGSLGEGDRSDQQIGIIETLASLLEVGPQLTEASSRFQIETEDVEGLQELTDEDPIVARSGGFGGSIVELCDSDPGGCDGIRVLTAASDYLFTPTEDLDADIGVQDPHREVSRPAVLARKIALIS